jgi:hypothetical protein
LLLLRRRLLLLRLLLHGGHGLHRWHRSATTEGLELVAVSKRGASCSSGSFHTVHFACGTFLRDHHPYDYDEDCNQHHRDEYCANNTKHNAGNGTRG